MLREGHTACRKHIDNPALSSVSLAWIDNSDNFTKNITESAALTVSTKDRHTHRRGDRMQKSRPDTDITTGPYPQVLRQRVNTFEILDAAYVADGMPIEWILDHAKRCKEPSK